MNSTTVHHKKKKNRVSLQMYSDRIIDEPVITIAKPTFLVLWIRANKAWHRPICWIVAYMQRMSITTNHVSFPIARKTAICEVSALSNSSLSVPVFAFCLAWISMPRTEVNNMQMHVCDSVRECICECQVAKDQGDDSERQSISF